MRILVVSGPSGGHIYPALSLLEKLKQNGAEPLLVLPKGRLSSRIACGYDVRYICVSAIKLNVRYSNIIALLSLIKAFFESLFLFIEFKPDVVVGFGSLASIPPVLLGWLFRTRTLIHEQNVIPGRANRFLGKFADKIAVSFPESRHYFTAESDKVAVTGNPLRKELRIINKKEALDFFGLEPNRFTILVMGGSQGSENINQAFLRSVSNLQEPFSQVIHLAGAADFESIAAAYKNLNISVKLFNFIDSMQYAYSAADLAICRAGAATITELIFFKLPAIIIPYPFAYAHQLENARILSDKGCAVTIQNAKLDGEALKGHIQNLMRDPNAISRMRSNYARLAILPAAELLAREVTVCN